MTDKEPTKNAGLVKGKFGVRVTPTQTNDKLKLNSNMVRGSPAKPNQENSKTRKSPSGEMTKIVLSNDALKSLQTKRTPASSNKGTRVPSKLESGKSGAQKKSETDQKTKKDSKEANRKPSNTSTTGLKVVAKIDKGKGIKGQSSQTDLKKKDGKSEPIKTDSKGRVNADQKKGVPRKDSKIGTSASLGKLSKPRATSNSRETLKKNNDKVIKVTPRKADDKKKDSKQSLKFKSKERARSEGKLVTRRPSLVTTKPRAASDRKPSKGDLKVSGAKKKSSITRVASKERKDSLRQPSGSNQAAKGKKRSLKQSSKEKAARSRDSKRMRRQSSKTKPSKESLKQSSQKKGSRKMSDTKINRDKSKTKNTTSGRKVSVTQLLVPGGFEGKGYPGKRTNSSNDPPKDVAKDLPKDVAKDPPKNVAKDPPKIVAKDPPKSIKSCPEPPKKGSNETGGATPSTPSKFNEKLYKTDPLADGKIQLRTTILALKEEPSMKYEITKKSDKIMIDDKSSKTKAMRTDKVAEPEVVKILKSDKAEEEKLAFLRNSPPKTQDKPNITELLHAAAVQKDTPVNFIRAETPEKDTEIPPIRLETSVKNNQIHLIRPETPLNDNQVQPIRVERSGFDDRTNLIPPQAPVNHDRIHFIRATTPGTDDQIHIIRAGTPGIDRMKVLGAETPEKDNKIHLIRPETPVNDNQEMTCKRRLLQEKEDTTHYGKDQGQPSIPASLGPPSTVPDHRSFIQRIQDEIIQKIQDRVRGLSGREVPRGVVIGVLVAVPIGLLYWMFAGSDDQEK